MPADVFVKRSEKLMFYGVPGTGNAVTYTRMKGFDSGERSDNPQEYSRQYIDEDAERNDVTGYSPEIALSFDQIVGNAVHGDILDIVDNEKIGSAAVRSILIVDLTDENTTAAGKYRARIRDYAILGDSDSRENLYNRSVTAKANGPIVTGYATTTDEWQTATFTADE